MSSFHAVQAQMAVPAALSLGPGELGPAHLHGLRVGCFSGVGGCAAAGTGSLPGLVGVPEMTEGASVGLSGVHAQGELDQPVQGSG